MRCAILIVVVALFATALAVNPDDDHVSQLGEMESQEDKKCDRRPQKSTGIPYDSVCQPSSPAEDGQFCIESDDENDPVTLTCGVCAQGTYSCLEMVHKPAEKESAVTATACKACNDGTTSQRWTFPTCDLHLNALMAMGFTKEDSLKALGEAGNDLSKVGKLLEGVDGAPEFSYNEDKMQFSTEDDSESKVAKIYEDSPTYGIVNDDAKAVVAMDDDKAVVAKADDSKADDAKADDSTADDSKADDSADDTAADDSTADDSKADEEEDADP